LKERAGFVNLGDHRKDSYFKVKDNKKEKLGSNLAGLEQPKNSWKEVKGGAVEYWFFLRSKDKFRLITTAMKFGQVIQGQQLLIFLHEPSIFYFS